MAGRGSIYVAEVSMPAALHGVEGARQEVPSPTYFDVTRGYWEIEYLPDQWDTLAPSGVKATVEFAADDLADAEERALAFGSQMGALLSFYTGSPAQAARLRRLAQVNASGELLAQFDYYYDYDRPPGVHLEALEFQRFVERFASREPAVQQRLEQASRWYGVAVGAVNPLDAYLALWIGLESIGPKLNERFHKAGSRASCSTCKNSPGESRNGMLAGVEHLVLKIAHEILDTRPFTDITRLRHDIVHSLKQAPVLAARASDMYPDLMLCLASGILTLMSVEDEESGTWFAALPRDYELRPDARSEITPGTPLLKHSPYLGTWISVERVLTDAHSFIEADGTYVFGHGVSLEIGYEVPHGSGKPPMTDHYVTFRREGFLYDATLGDQQGGHAAPKSVQWGKSTMTAAWKRHLDADEPPDDRAQL